MTLPVRHPFSERTHLSATSDLTTGQTAAVRMPGPGRLVCLRSTLGSAAATGDATVTCSLVTSGSSIATAITGGSYTITQANSFAGQVFGAAPTALTYVGEDDAILFSVTGTSTSGGAVSHEAVIRHD